MMRAVITPHVRPSIFIHPPPASDLFVQEQRQAKLGDFATTLAAMDTACPRPDKSRGRRPPYPTEILTRMAFLQALYNLSDKECEHQVPAEPPL